MLEVQGNILPFPVHYTTDGVSTTGLTVTVDIYERTVAGTVTQVVDDGACTEIGAGLYVYDLAAASVDADAIYLAVFHTATDTVDQQDLPSEWIVGRTWVKNVQAILADTGTDGVVLKAAGLAADAVTEIQSGLATPASVWANSTRTLTQSAASVASAVAGSTITATRGDTLSAALTNIGALTNYSKVWFTVKADDSDTDAESLVQIEKSAGLKYINGAAAVTAGNGSITIDDEATGDITIALDEVETAKLSPGSYHYDIQILRSTGIAVSTLSSGTFIVSADYTLATS